MFIISLTYECDIEKIDFYLEEHIAYLKRHYKAGHFVASGRKVPRVGGVIMAQMDSNEKLSAILKEDPFYREKLAKYDIMEFTPTMVAGGLEKIIKVG